MILVKQAFVGLTFLIVSAGVASAATLNFNEIGAAGPLSGPTLSLSNATLSNAGSGDFLIFDGTDPDVPGLNGKGSVCGYDGSECLSSMKITFHQDIQNFSMRFNEYDDNDQVWINIYDGATLKGTEIVTSQASLDLTSYGLINELMFLNVGSGGGLVYSDFNFDYENESIASAPLPAALPMFGAALAMLGFRGWRRRKS